MENKEKAEKILKRNFATGTDLKDYKKVKKMLMEMAKWKDEQHNKNVKTWQLELEKKQILIGELYEQIGTLIEELHKKD